MTEFAGMWIEKWEDYLHDIPLDVVTTGYKCKSCPEILCHPRTLHKCPADKDDKYDNVHRIFKHRLEVQKKYNKPIVIIYKY